jgi:uncharacterized DUF497 family protein
MNSKEPAIINNDNETNTKRIICIGKIHKGKKTMIIAFPQKGLNSHAVSQRRDEEED